MKLGLLFSILFSIVAFTPVFASSPAHTGLFAGAETAETAYYNPAGMVRFEETTKTIQCIFAYSFSEFEVDTNLTSVNGGNPDSDNTPIIVPGFYYVRPFNEDWWLGFSLNVPSGFGSDYGGNWSGRYYTDKYSLFYVSATPSIAYRVNRHWSVGGSINLTYAYTESETKINNPGAGQADGQLEFDADAVGIAGTVSLLYQFNEKTRLGLSYTGETRTDLKDTLSLKGLGPVLDATIGRLDGAEIEIENVLPQRIQAGIYHQFTSGHYMTADVAWVDFSKFSTGSISIENGVEVTPEGIYDDLWLFSLGMGVPVNDSTTWKMGLMYLSQAIDDDKRKLSMRLDQTWGAGVGIRKKLRESLLDINLNFYHLGDGSVDTDPGNPLRGRIAGESSNPYAVAFDVAWHW